MNAAVQFPIDWTGGPLRLDDTPPAARASDPATAKDAAAAIRPHRQRVRDLVLAEYRARGPMTAKECEDALAYLGLGFSTIRKRVSELARPEHDCKLVGTGVVRDRSAEYALAVQP